LAGKTRSLIWFQFTVRPLAKRSAELVKDERFIVYMAEPVRTCRQMRFWTIAWLAPELATLTHEIQGVLLLIE